MANQQARPRLSRLPPWLSHWLGHRPAPPSPPPSWAIYLWAFVGSFLGLTILQSLFTYSAYFTARDVPSLIASYGASAVLCYHAIDSPLAQPRALVGGHFLSALTGLCVTKLFALAPAPQFQEQLRWLAAGLSTALAIVLMGLTATTHPPAGATALLPALDERVWRLGWYYLPVVLLSSSLVLASALLVNNVQRRYPVFWIAPPGEMRTPNPLPGLRGMLGRAKGNEDAAAAEKEKRRPKEDDASDVEKQAGSGSDSSAADDGGESARSV